MRRKKKIENPFVFPSSWFRQNSSQCVQCRRADIAVVSIGCEIGSLCNCVSSYRIDFVMHVPCSRRHCHRNSRVKSRFKQIQLEIPFMKYAVFNLVARRLQNFVLLPSFIKFGSVRAHTRLRGANYTRNLNIRGQCWVFASHYLLILWKHKL